MWQWHKHNVGPTDKTLLGHPLFPPLSQGCTIVGPPLGQQLCAIWEWLALGNSFSPPAQLLSNIGKSGQCSANQETSGSMLATSEPIFGQSWQIYWLAQLTLINDIHKELLFTGGKLSSWANIEPLVSWFAQCSVTGVFQQLNFICKYTGLFHNSIKRHQVCLLTSMLVVTVLWAMVTWAWIFQWPFTI